MSEPLITWESAHQLGRITTNTRYYVVKYRDGIRKRAALCRRGPESQKVIAYFTSEDEAKEFCNMLLGGIEMWGKGDE